MRNSSEESGANRAAPEKMAAKQLGTDDAPQGTTRTSPQDDQKPARNPSDRDESADSQASDAPSHSVKGKIAYDDAAGPAQDTDRGALTDKVYNDKIVLPSGRT